MPLFWRPQLAVGYEPIDHDHKYLILLINTVELVLSTPGNRKYIIEAFDALEAYAREHFDREEGIQIASRYTHSDQHKIEHKALLNKLSDLRGEIEMSLLAMDSEDEIDPAEAERISAFLRAWLVDHVVAKDLKMRDMFATKRVVR